MKTLRRHQTGSRPSSRATPTDPDRAAGHHILKNDESPKETLKKTKKKRYENEKKYENVENDLKTEPFFSHFQEKR